MNLTFTLQGPTIQPTDSALLAACAAVAYEHRVARWCHQLWSTLEPDNEVGPSRDLREHSLLYVLRNHLHKVDENALLALLEAQPVPTSATGVPVFPPVRDEKQVAMPSVSMLLTVNVAQTGRMGELRSTTGRRRRWRPTMPTWLSAKSRRW